MHSLATRAQVLNDLDWQRGMALQEDECEGGERVPSVAEGVKADSRDFKNRRKNYGVGVDEM